MLCKKDTLSNDLIDFASNYLGFLSQKFFKDRQYLIKNSIVVPSFYLGTGRCWNRRFIANFIKRKQP
jgi:hypothetical protein